jgi:cytoskeletal protein RodZ
VNPGGGSGWDEPPLDIQIPDDARELQRDVLAYHREMRAERRRKRLRRLAGPFAPSAARGSVMPLLASILAVCLVAGAMLSVATFSPATSTVEQPSRPATATSSVRPPSSPAASASHRASHSASPSASALPSTGPSTGAATGPATGHTKPAVHVSVTGSAGAPR